MHNKLKFLIVLFPFVIVSLGAQNPYGMVNQPANSASYKKAYLGFKMVKRKAKKRRKSKKKGNFKVSYRKWHRHMKSLLTNRIQEMNKLACDCEQLAVQLEPYHNVIRNNGFGNRFNHEEVAQNYIRAYESTPSWHSNANLTTAYLLYKSIWANLLFMNDTYQSMKSLKGKKYRVRKFKKGRITKAAPYHFSTIHEEDFFLKKHSNYVLSYSIVRKKRNYSPTKYKKIKVQGVWNDFVRRVVYGLSL